MYCARHPKEETSLTCGRCGKPICVRCVVHADVGIRCRECAPARPTNLGKRTSLVGGGLGLLVLIVVGGSLLSGSGLFSSSDDGWEPPDVFAPESVTVHEVVDPWTSPAPDDQPAPGRRFVAASVTIENPEDSGGTTFISAGFFKMTDENRIAYAPTASDIGDLDLAPGEKTRGWVVFEIDKLSAIKSLTYVTTEVALPH